MNDELDARGWLIRIARYLGDQAQDLDTRTDYDLGARAWEVLDDAHEDLLNALRTINKRGCERSVSIRGRCLSEYPQGEWCDPCIAAAALPPARIEPGALLNRRCDLDAVPDHACGRDGNGFLVVKYEGRWRRVLPPWMDESMSDKEPTKYVRLLDLGGDDS